MGAKIAQESTLAASVAGEDLRIGEYVAVLNEVHEFPSFFWDCDATTLSPHEVVRLRYTARDAGTPLRVEAVCLPFVLLRTPTGECRTLDVRLVQLVRLDERYAKLVRKELRRRQPGRAPVNAD